MLTSPTAAFDAEITADIRRPAVDVSIDNTIVNSLVSSVQIDTSITTDLPASTTLVAGARTTSATIALEGSGDGDTTVSTIDLLHPLSTHPSAKGDITARSAQAWLRFAGASLLQFTGACRKVTFREGSGAVTVNVTDGSAMLGDTVTLPAFGSTSANRYSDAGEAVSPLSPVFRYYLANARIGTNLAGVITWALHSANIGGLRVTPDVSTGTFVSMPGVGGYLMDRGRAHLYDTMQFGEPPYDLNTIFGADPIGTSRYIDGPYGPCPNPTRLFGSPTDSVLSVDLDSYPVYWTSGPLKFEGYAYFPADDGTPTWSQKHTVARVFMKGGGPGFQVSMAGATLTLDWFTYGSTTLTAIGATGTVTPGWHWFGIDVRPSDPSTVAAQFRIDDGTVTTASVAMSSVPYAVGFAHVGTSVALQAFSIGISTSFRPLPSVFTPRAFVELSSTELDRVPALTDTQWSIISQCAAADLGTAGFDNAGVFRFRSGYTLRNVTTPVRTFTRDVVGDLSGYRAWDSVRNSFTGKAGNRSYMFAWSSGGTTDLPSTPRKIFSFDNSVVTLSAPGAGSDVHDYNGRVVFPPGTTTVRLAGQTSIATDLASFRLYQSPADALAGPGMYLTQWSLETSATPTSSGVTVSAVQVATNAVEITVVNSSGTTQYCTWPPDWKTSTGFGYGFSPASTDVSVLRAGHDALGVYGFVADDSEAALWTVNVSDSASVATYGAQSISTSNPFLTTKAALTRWAQTLINDLKGGTLILDTITVPGDPRITVGDSIVVADPTGRFQSVTLRIMRVLRTFSVRGGFTDEYTVRAL